MQDTGGKRILGAPARLRPRADRRRLDNSRTSSPTGSSTLAIAVAAPGEPGHLHGAVGIVEIVVGLGVLTGHARVFGWIAAAGSRPSR